MPASVHRHILTVAATVVVLSGCSPRYVQVRTVPELYDSSVRVDLIGVADAEREQYADLSNYWQPYSKLRAAAMSRGVVYEMKFGGSNPPTRKVTPSDTVWKTWKKVGADWIYLIADLPAVGPEGTRPLTVEICEAQKYEVSVHPGGIFVDPEAPLETK